MTATLATVAAATAALASAGCGGSSTSGTTHSTSSSVSSSSTGGPTAQAPSSPPTATASAGAADTVGAGAGGVSATMLGSTHQPKVGQPWPFHLTVTRSGQPARASVTYEYVFAGQVVARRAHYSFDGHFSDDIIWPASAVGYPLSFRAAIVSEAATINLDYPVQVMR
ncbi:MAG TPA: hypothetical protein VKG38_19240 [Solirubrobacteraceae bacterium]|nr:hypothetical protein [Solirubrobacteraceae bacterium]